MRRAQRLRGRGRFGDAVRSRAVRCDGLRFHALENGLGRPRFGLSVRGSRGAVERNRARRRLYEALRVHAAGLGGLDVVAVAPASVAAQPWAELTSAVATCVERLAGRGEAAP